MSLIEASGALGIPRQTLYMMIIDGKLPATRNDYGLWEIPNEELERIMQKLGPLQPRGWAEQYVLDVLDQSPVALKAGEIIRKVKEKLPATHHGRPTRITPTAVYHVLVKLKRTTPPMIVKDEHGAYTRPTLSFPEAA
jgi:excisionase family DNA binding protein